jgi:hypothetical protein
VQAWLVVDGESGWIKMMWRARRHNKTNGIISDEIDKIAVSDVRGGFPR